jgi:hypothetical protein
MDRRDDRTGAEKLRDTSIDWPIKASDVRSAASFMDVKIPTSDSVVTPWGSIKFIPPPENFSAAGGKPAWDLPQDIVSAEYGGGPVRGFDGSIPPGMSTDIGGRNFAKLPPRMISPTQNLQDICVVLSARLLDFEHALSLMPDGRRHTSDGTRSQTKSS